MVEGWKDAKVRRNGSLSNSVSCKSLVQAAPQTLEQTRGRHDASTPDDAFGRPSQHQRHGEITEIVSHEIKDRGIIHKRPVPSQSTRNRRSCREPLNTVFVEGAHALCRIVTARQADVADLGVQSSLERLAIHQETAADAGPHRDVSETPNAPSRTELPLGAAGRIDIGIDHNGHGEPSGKSGTQVRAAPTGFGSV